MGSVNAPARYLTAARLPLLVGLMLASLLLTACWPLAEPPATAPAGSGGLRLVGWAARTLDPARADDPASLLLVQAIYSGLLTYDAKLNPLPDLASSLPSISDDGRTYAFTLRDNLSFHNGRTITAADVKYSIERSCSPATAAPAPAASLPCARLLANVRGVADLLAGKSNQAEGIVVLDASHLNISLNRSDATFLSKLAAPSNALLDRSLVEGNPTWTLNPVGSGPYLVLKSDQQGVELGRFAAYDGPTVALDHITVSDGDGQAAFADGSADLALVLAGVASPNVGQLRTAANLRLSYLGLNTRLKPFDDPLVRHALTLGLDQDALAGAGQPATSLLPPILRTTTSRFDRGAALRLLAESSYKGAANLPPIMIHSTGSPLAASVAAILRDSLGLKVSVQAVEYSDFIRQRSSYQAFVDDYQPAYPGGLALFEPLLATKGEANYTGYSNAEVDRQLAALDEETDVGKRAAALRQLEATANDLPLVPLVWQAQTLLVSERVEGLPLGPYGLELRRLQLKNPLSANSLQAYPDRRASHYLPSL